MNQSRGWYFIGRFPIQIKKQQYLLKCSRLLIMIRAKFNWVRKLLSILRRLFFVSSWRGRHWGPNRPVLQQMLGKCLTNWKAQNYDFRAFLYKSNGDESVHETKTHGCVRPTLKWKPFQSAYLPTYVPLIPSSEYPALTLICQDCTFLKTCKNLNRFSLDGYLSWETDIVIMYYMSILFYFLEMGTHYVHSIQRNKLFEWSAGYYGTVRTSHLVFFNFWKNYNRPLGGLRPPISEYYFVRIVPFYSILDSKLYFIC